jgi:hypothetical protein
VGVIGAEATALFSASHEPEAIGAVLHIQLRVIEAQLRERSRCPEGRLGAVSFGQRFGSALNAHVHFHCCVIDGVFTAGADGQVKFAGSPALRPEDLAAVRQQVRRRVLRAVRGPDALHRLRDGPVGGENDPRTSG